MAPAKAGPAKRAARPVRFTMGYVDDGDDDGNNDEVFTDDDDDDDNDGGGVWHDQSASSSSKTKLDCARPGHAPAAAATRRNPPSPSAKPARADPSSSTAADRRKEAKEHEDKDEEEVDNVDEDDDSDAWSSETDDSDEERERLAAAAAAEAKTKAKAAAAAEEKRRRQRQEEEESMFKKRPIRSQSAADVSLLGEPHTGLSNGRAASSSKHGSLNGISNNPVAAAAAAEAAAPAPPVRGILTSIFHPEQGPHSPPGQLVGRPHASAADLRQVPSRTRSPPQGASRRPPASSAISNSKRRSYVDLVEYRQQATGDGPGGDGSGSGGAGGAGTGTSSGGRLPKVPSSPQVAEMGNQGGLRSSKSAVALPVLTSLQMKISPSWTSPPRSSVEDTSHLMSSTPSQRQMGQNGVHKGAQQQQSTSASAQGASSAPDTHDKPVVSAKPAEIDMPARRRSTGEDLGDEGAGMPLTPKTTRRNMIQHELSESLRENLLWERQNRQRMLGIGAIGPLDHHFQQPPPPIEETYRSSNRQQQQQQQQRQLPLQQQQHQQHQQHQQRAPRGQSVLSGGLRPLTSSSNVAQQANTARSQHDTNTLHRHYTGDFHVSGW